MRLDRTGVKVNHRTTQAFASAGHLGKNQAVRIRATTIELTTCAHGNRFRVQ
jgi:hypothetical protein